MDRMKTFFKYAICLIVFFAISMLLENVLLKSMYSKISGEIDTHYSVTDTQFKVENISAKACNINGYVLFNLINTTGKDVEKCYLKLDLYNERDQLADTEYIEIDNLKEGETKNFNVKFKANNIEKFKAEIVEDVPDKTNIINILGWEIDLTNVFGLGIDISNFSVFGRKLSEVFDWENIKSSGSKAWTWIVMFTTGIPWWAYAAAWLFYVGLL